LDVLVAINTQDLEGPVLGDLTTQKLDKEAELETEKENLTNLESERFSFRKGYRNKYSGSLAGQWPCGCEKMVVGAWEEGDSEAE
jgi:hypothetical protein